MSLADLNDADLRALTLRQRRLLRREPPPRAWRDEQRVELVGTVVRRGTRRDGWARMQVVSDWRDGTTVEVSVRSSSVRVLPLKGVRVRVVGRAFCDGPASRQLIADRFEVLPADEGA